MTRIGSGDPAYVLYVDHQGHPAPLSECFHATASRRLSSTVDRQHRPSTVTQVDSAYCPQCLSFHDASSATQLGYCPKPTCVRCPLCTSIVSCSKVEGSFCFTCGRCDWNSLQCNLKVASTSTSGAAAKEEVVNAVAQLATLLQERRQEGGYAKTAQDHYQNMIAAWEGVVKKGPTSSASRNLQFKSGRRPKQEEESWSVDALESAIQTKKQELAENAVVGGQALQRISLEQEQTLGPDLQEKSSESLSLQALTAVPTMTLADLLPLQVPLRSRKSRRCRAELADGKPGILLKPKLNPLEGDSSLRTGHGQWWKKDSSAVHVVPRVRVTACGSKSVDGNIQHHAFVLKVTNSTLGLVRLRIGSSKYRGEASWEDHSNKLSSLENLLVETLSNKHVDAFLLEPGEQEQSSLLSEVVVLESAEDSLVDIGKVSEVPDGVANWDVAKALEASPPSTAASFGAAENRVLFSSVKLLAEKSGSAWFELVCATKHTSADNTTDPYSAIPISLQIEVGNGSWESSLIKANTTKEEEKDMVTFDLVVTWPNSTAE